MSVPTAKMAITAPLIVHAADALQRARKLPAGPVRNDFRALARALLRIHKAGLRANVRILEMPTRH